MPSFQPASFPLPETPRWRSRLLAWPGVLTLLSVLAVLLGHQPPLPDPGPRVTAGAVAPALPELRPAPQPTPGPVLSPAPPPEPVWVPGRVSGPAKELPEWTVFPPGWSLALLGRRQTDGG